MQKVMGVAFLVVVTGLNVAADDWWSTDLPFRVRTHINASEITEDLVDFPLAIRIGSPGDALVTASPDGTDSRVVDAAGQVLAFEKVRWDRDALELYARMPRIAAGKPGQYVDVYFGNKNAKAESQGPVWGDGYRLVLHLNGNLADSSLGVTTVKPEGAIEVGATAVFNSDPAFLNIDPKTLEGVGEQITINIRFRVQGGNSVQNLASGLKPDGPEEWFNFGLKTPNVVHTNATSEGKRAGELNPTGIAPNEWHAATVVYDARNRTRTICIDGTVLERDQALTGPLRVREMRIGRGVLHFDPWQFAGEMDEVRFSAIARSDSWIRAETAGLGDQNAFSVSGPVEEFGKPTPPPSAFRLLSPSDGFECRKRDGVTVKWSPSAGAETYTVLVFADAAVSEPLQTFDSGQATLFAIPSAAFNGKTVFWSVQAKGAGGIVQNSDKRKLSFYNWSNTMASLPENKTNPELGTASDAAYEIQGYLRTRIDNSIKRYFLETPESSPAILQVLRDRDKVPVRDPLVPWAGEFAGKYLTGAELVWRLTKDPELKETIDQFVRALIACQAPNGYLGPFPKDARLTGSNWDVWGHYHCMIGLMLYFEDTGYEPALEACRKAADLLFETFGPGGPTLTNDGAGGQMNMAICHSLVILYRKTGLQRYLDLARYVIHEAWNEEGAGKYIESALAGKKVHEFPQHRWEALHDYQALAEMYWLTGDDQYRQTMEQIWWSGVSTDRHNTGGVTSGEGFCGSPYNLGAIETCCTVAWIAFSLDVLRMTGDSRIADEIEWSTLNSALAAIPYSGRVCAYNVPMDGTRVFGVELPWQSPKAGPDLNCCAVNAYRPLGMIAQWALMESKDGLVVNYYGPCTMSAKRPSGNEVTLKQETGYPAEGKIRIAIETKKPESFTISLRIPAWSKHSIVSVNGKDIEATAGTYVPLAQEWKSGDVIELNLDFSLRFWAGEQECAGKISVFRGPMLYAFDGRYSDLNPDALPKLDWKTAQLEPRTWDEDIPPWMLATLKDANGTTYPVCDLSSAGQTGNHYRSWLPADALPPSPFHLVTPKDGEAGTVLTWEKRGGAETWTVLVSASRDFRDAKMFEVRETPEVKLDLPSGAYFWTVVARNSNGETNAANSPRRFLLTR